MGTEPYMGWLDSLQLGDLSDLRIHNSLKKQIHTIEVTNDPFSLYHFGIVHLELYLLKLMMSIVPNNSPQSKRHLKLTLYS